MKNSILHTGVSIFYYMEKYHVSRGPISVTISHAAERIYTREEASIFAHF